MSRARIGAIGIAALVPALLLATGCSVLSDAKKGVDAAANKVDVCNATITLMNDHIKNVETAVDTYNAAKPGDTAARTTFTKSIGTEFGALKTGVDKQAGKAQDAELKTALQGLSTVVGAFSTKPEVYADDNAASMKKLNDAGDTINKTCSAPKK